MTKHSGDTCACINVGIPLFAAVCCMTVDLAVIIRRIRRDEDDRVLCDRSQSDCDSHV